ncbi:MAG: amidophosphoribosyltransferase [Legionellales bacterium RIFCSPHIGHO2_12_FULL_42_9]|nr:MAG: amidophosphoribosyltransferase [Legionellales bacterium RIFCSPHIGHO2_12_FULL_42_9]
MAICEPCAQLFPILENPCQYCSQPLPNNDFLICGECLGKKPAFDRVMTGYRFEEPLRTLLHEFKYKNGLHLRPALVELMMQAFDSQAALADCVMPIPLHSKRIQQRGFNQAAELAKRLALKLNIPYDARICKKMTNTSPQVGLSAEERRKNLRHSFSAKPSSYEYVLLIDDLITTGSTANEMAKVLKKQGVQRVDLWCCARA